jgi:signal transduction histidine kinase/HAMP domain-containing protein
MQLGLKTRILVGFLAIVVAFAGTTLFALSRMQGLRDDLRLIHRGYLTMNRYTTGVRTLQEAKDVYVRRALAEADPRLRRHLVAYARTFYPRAIRDRLAEIETRAQDLQAQHLGAAQQALLDDVRTSVERTTVRHDAYDEATAALLDGLDDPALDEATRVEQLAAYTETGEALGQEVQTLQTRTEKMLASAVIRAERDEREGRLAVLLLSAFACLIGGLVVWAMGRGLRPLASVLESARAIGRGSLDVEVPLTGPEEVAALAREFNVMAKALRDREQAATGHNEDLTRLKLFADDVIRSVQVGIVVVDAEGRIRTFNPAARSVLSLPLVDVEGRAFKDLPDLDSSLADVLAAVPAVRQTGAPASFPHTNVGDKIVDIAVVAIRDRAGEAATGDVLLLGEDVTEREQAKGRLVESERLAAIGRLAAQITHEIRNPLSSIGLNIDLLGDDVPPPARQPPAGSEGDPRGGRRRGESAQPDHRGLPALRAAADPAPEPGDVADLVAALAAFNQGEAESAGVMLELNIHDATPAVSHDPSRLRQALLNLLRNALEAAGRGGTVRLSVQPFEGGARLCVDDSGVGLDDAQKAKLFEPFFTTKPQGTGLGLTLAQQIIREHGGKLSAHDSDLGGARFVIDLPATNADDDVATPPPLERESA